MNDYEIQFTGLKLGTHSFQFELSNKFFEFFKNQDQELSLVDGGNILVQLELEKKETMLVLNFSINGQVDVACDRCMERLSTSISSTNRIIGKFSDEETWNEDEIIHISSSAYKVDIKELLYEFICLAIPAKNVHSDGECNPEMIKKLNEYRYSNDDEEKIDPRWDKLKNL
ncbi:MAG: hypothetical protein CL840_09305 [Crocinitomicaceae bacterium]|mgnify:CR=1 FL=1|nr:hypothetical protein [Crocinitomicaceae bacterium]|tara:strand:- start:5313 stop:5825 length:513 start_codon:yes stop_codon:yes gene_type:complete